MSTSSSGSAVSTEIGFEYDQQATAAAIAHLNSKFTSPLTAPMLGTLLFLADREHLIRFGRPITGDYYEAAESGPVPTRIFNPRLTGVDMGSVQDLLSQSDIMVLDQVVCVQDAVAVAKATKAYKLAWQRAVGSGRVRLPIYFEDFFLDGTKAQQEILEGLIEDQRIRRTFPDVLTF